MPRNAILANSEHYIFKIFLESMPPDPRRRPNNFFLVVAWLKTFFRIDSPPQKKQKILDWTLMDITDSGLILFLLFCWQ